MSVTTERTVVIPTGAESELYLQLKTYRATDCQWETDSTESVEARLRHRINRTARMDHLVHLPPVLTWTNAHDGTPMCVATLRGVTVDDPDLLAHAQTWVNDHAAELTEVRYAS